MRREAWVVVILAMLFVLTVVTVVFAQPPAPEPELEQLSLTVNDKAADDGVRNWSHYGITE